jgi:hypothetical protein
MKNNKNFSQKHFSAYSREEARERYEQMYRVLYDYYFKEIDFLELISTWEQLMCIPALPTETLLSEQVG